MVSPSVARPIRNEWPALSTVENRSPHHTVAARSGKAIGRSSKENATTYIATVKATMATSSAQVPSPSSGVRARRGEALAQQEAEGDDDAGAAQVAAEPQQARHRRVVAGARGDAAEVRIAPTAIAMTSAAPRLARARGRSSAPVATTAPHLRAPARSRNTASSVWTSVVAAKMPACSGSAPVMVLAPYATAARRSVSMLRTRTPRSRNQRTATPPIGIAVPKPGAG